MIYIDPPYNTGNDFVYHDDFHRTQAEEDLEAGNVDELGNRFVKNTETNGKFHSDWCSMIYPRLQLARTLLSEDGVIFISIDDNEVENLRKICDELFGEENFLGIITWSKKRKGSFLSKNIISLTEYLIVYAKAIDVFKGLFGGKADTTESQPIIKRTNKKSTLSIPANLVKSKLSDGVYYKGIYGDSINPVELLDDVTVKQGLITNDFRINAPFIWTQQMFDNEISKGTKPVINTKNFQIRVFRVYDDGNFKGLGSLIDGVKIKGTNEDAYEELESMFGIKKLFDYSKPVNYIKSLVLASTYFDKNAIVLDFFSGSATTAHAVMQLNAEDGGHRKFILVQLPEETDKDSEAYKAGYKNICEIGEERIRRAGKKIKEELQGAALVAVRNGKSSQGDLFDQGNQQADGHEGRTLQADDLDTGFRVFRIDSSNMKDVYFAPKDLEPQQLDLFADNVKEDRTELDLLYGCMVDWGVPLSLPLSEETIDVADGHTMATDDGTIADGHKGRTLQADGNGVTVYTVNDGDLVACFGKPITDNVVKAMADKAPLRVLFRDSCFEKDEQKINIFEQFKQLLGWSDDEALNNIRVI